MGQPELSEAFDAASIQGLDQIYESDPAQAQTAPALAQNDPTKEVWAIQGQEVQPDPNMGICLEEASKALGLHIDTVRKRLQKGKLRGFKVADKFGEKWFVYRTELPVPNASQPLPSQEDQTAPALANVDPPQEHQRRPSTVQPDPNPESIEALGDPIVDVEIGPEPVPHPTSDVEYQRLISIIESQAHQLKAAGDVIVYLKSEVDDAKAQVKLLTDSQHKSGWWARFCSWFNSPK